MYESEVVNQLSRPLVSVWSACGPRGRIAELLSETEVSNVRGIFPYGIRALCPAVDGQGNELSWSSLIVPLGGTYPPDRRLDEELTSLGCGEVLRSLSSSGGPDWGIFGAIVQHLAEEDPSGEWFGAVWDVLGEPLGSDKQDRHFIHVHDAEDYGTSYEYQLVRAKKSDLAKRWDMRERVPSYLWNQSESIYVEAQPYVGWIEVRGLNPSVIENVRELDGIEFVPSISN